jgi:hypothetical protein
MTMTVTMTVAVAVKTSAHRRVTVPPAGAQPYTGNVGQRVDGHTAALERHRAGERPPPPALFVCECSCGWTARADRARVIERLRHRHLTLMVEAGARVVRAGQ